MQDAFIVCLIAHFFIIFTILFNGYPYYKYKESISNDFVIVDNIKISQLANYITEKSSDKDNIYSSSDTHSAENKNAVTHSKNDDYLLIKQTINNNKINKPKRNTRILKIQEKDKEVKNNFVKTPTIRRRALTQDNKISSILLSIDSRKKYVMDRGKEQKGLLGKQSESKENMNTESENNYTTSVIDSIKGQFTGCWTLPAGIVSGKNMVVVLSLELDKSGNIIKVNITNKSRYNKDKLYRVFVDSAVRAVRKCSPLQGLEKIPYDKWRNIDMVFDPESMF